MRKPGDRNKPFTEQKQPLIQRRFSRWSSLGGVSKPRNRSQLSDETVDAIWQHVHHTTTRRK